MINNFMSGVKQRYNEYTKPSKPTEPTDLPSLLKSSKSLIIYPDQANFNRSFVVGTKENPSDVKFITECDPYFFDKNLIKLSDGTSEGKEIEVLPGEICMPFTALTKDNQEVQFYLPGKLVYKMQTEDKVSLLIEGKQVEVYLCKHGDYRHPDSPTKIESKENAPKLYENNGLKITEGEFSGVYSIDNKVIPTIFKIATKDLINNQLILLTEKRNGTKRFAHASTPVALVDGKLPEGPMYEIVNWKEEVTLLMKELSTDKKLTTLRNKENFIGEFHLGENTRQLVEVSPEARVSREQLANINFSNCEIFSAFNLSKTSEESFILDIRFTGTNPHKSNMEWDIFANNDNRKQFIALYEDQLVVLKTNPIFISNVTFIEKGIKDNYLTIFDFKEFGITLEQMKAALSLDLQTQKGITRIFIPAPAPQNED